jgi:hypothetical protein
MNWLLLLPVNEKSRCWTNRRGEPPTKYHVCRRFRLYGNTDHAQYIRAKAHTSILPARELEHEYGRELRSHFGGMRQQIRFSGDTRQRILTYLLHAMHEGWSFIVPIILQMQGGITLARGCLSDAALSHSPAREYCAPSPAWEILEDPFPRTCPISCMPASAARLYRHYSEALRIHCFRSYPGLGQRPIRTWLAAGRQ